MHTGRLEVVVDHTGMILICFTSFTASVPFIIAPVLTYFQFDPTFLLFNLTIPSFFMKNAIFVYFLLPLVRFITVLVYALEMCRILSFVLVCGACLLQSTAIFIESLKKKAMLIRHRFMFLINFQTYTILLMNCSKANLIMGQNVLVTITACLLILIWSGYATVALRSTIPLPYYLILPMATILGQLGFRQALASGINCHEQSCALLQIWKYTVLRTHNRKFMIKKVEGMPPIRVYARALSFNLYYLKRSTMGTSFTIIITHTVNAVLLIPAPNIP
jgi:hypothetical protein